MAASQSARRYLAAVGYRTPIALMAVGFYVPLLALVVFSFWTRSGLWMEPELTLRAYEQLFVTNSGQFVHSIVLGVLAGTLALLLAFPVAYTVTYIASDLQQTVVLAIFAVPFFVSPFVRILMLVPILGTNGIINRILLLTGLVDEPLTFLIYSDLGVVIGMAVSLLPFIVFTGWLSMEMIDVELKDAAENLGARPIVSVLTVVVPLSIAGLLVGVLFVFSSAIGESLFPRVLGGPDANSLGLMTQRAFQQLNVPFAAAISVTSLALYVASLFVITRYVDLAELFTAFRED